MKEVQAVKLRKLHFGPCSQSILMQTVTILAAIFIPVSLSTSIFGMNIQQINESGHDIVAFLGTALALINLTLSIWLCANMVTRSVRNWRHRDFTSAMERRGNHGVRVSIKDLVKKPGPKARNILDLLNNLSWGHYGLKHNKTVQSSWSAPQRELCYLTGLYSLDNAPKRPHRLTEQMSEHGECRERCKTVQPQALRVLQSGYQIQLGQVFCLRGEARHDGCIYVERLESFLLLRHRYHQHEVVSGAFVRAWHRLSVWEDAWRPSSRGMALYPP